MFSIGKRVRSEHTRTPNGSGNRVSTSSSYMPLAGMKSVFKTLRMAPGMVFVVGPENGPRPSRAVCWTHIRSELGDSGKGEHGSRREAERHSGAKRRAGSAGIRVQGKGAAAPLPLLLCIEDRDHSGLGALDGLRFFRMDSPRISMRWALWTKRSRMLSAMVGSPICSCQRETVSWEVRTVERVWKAILADFQTSRRSLSFSGAMAQSSITRTSIRLSRAKLTTLLQSAHKSMLAHKSTL
jgi:hypothetical protein